MRWIMVHDNWTYTYIYFYWTEGGDSIYWVSCQGMLWIYSSLCSHVADSPNSGLSPKWLCFDRYETIMKAISMMTSSNGNIFRVTGPLYGEFSGHRWIPRTKASDAELWWVFFICAWINSWVNNREADDLRRHRAHYDVIVMFSVIGKNSWLEG